MIKAGIIGGAGYTAGELVRLLISHPAVELSYVQSKSNGGNRIDFIHRDLVGSTDQLFSSEHNFDVDLIFLCTGHGKSVEFLDTVHLPDHIKIIDLSTDFRPRGNKMGFVYGLTELNKLSIQSASKIANPGCFATCIQLGLLPLAKAKKLQNDVHVHAITGSTGAGVGLSNTTHFSWRESNVSIYKPFTHQHLTEIEESLTLLQGDSKGILNFIPVRGNFTRGIYASLYMPYSGTLDAVSELYEEYYRDSPFTHLSQSPLDLKQIVNTNKCLIHLEVIEGKLLITSVLDNLLKGASGQAVENMNLMFGLNQSEGLNLKGTAF